ncbi:MAG TPA: cell envelope integrity protein TolA [Candidatus Binataceae bacterium]|nr:cell envelope integrity protein TolA [Candidatus Binataceae bacterium]
MALPDKDRISLKYAAAIGVSALVHVVFLYLVLFVLPRWLTAEETPPPAYTVAIVDNLPAGDLGMHLPPLRGAHHKGKAAPPPEEENPPEASREEPPPKPGANKIEAPDTDRNAIALNSTRPTEVPTPEPTPTPTPEPVATPEPTAAPTQMATQPPTAIPTLRPRPTMRPKPTPRPRAEAHKLNKHLKPPKLNIKPRVMLAARPPIPRAARTPSVKERLAMLRKHLMEEHLQMLAKMAKAREDVEPDSSDNDSGDETSATSHGPRQSGGGPVAGSAVTNGRGYGVGPGTGSAGILSDPEFLLYYQKVQERIKDAWSFGGGRKDLTTTVNFAIGPDGRLTGLEVAHSSRNESFDQSVLRAIRRAAPFPPPPERYRDQFGQGVEAVFELGELRS